MAFAEDEEWVAEMFMTAADLVIDTAQAMLDAGYHFDGAFLYDDMGYRNGTLFSPTSTVAWRSPRTRRRSASSGTGACRSSCTPAAA